MKFGKALRALRKDEKVTRSAWDGSFLQLQKPDEDSKMTVSYIFLEDPDGDRVPWVASHEDLLADDWEVTV